MPCCRPARRCDSPFCHQAGVDLWPGGLVGQLGPQKIPFTALRALSGAAVPGLPMPSGGPRCWITAAWPGRFHQAFVSINGWGLVRAAWRRRLEQPTTHDGRRSALLPGGTQSSSSHPPGRGGRSRRGAGYWQGRAGLHGGGRPRRDDPVRIPLTPGDDGQDHVARRTEVELATVPLSGNAVPVDSGADLVNIG